MLNRQSLIINTQHGFIALTSVLILAAVIVLLIIGIFGGAASEMERGVEKEKGEKALSWANLCMEKALNELRNNCNYTGNVTNTTVAGVDGSCDILTFETAGGTITITTEGNVLGHTRKMQVEVVEDSDPLNVTTWQEIE